MVSMLRQSPIDCHKDAAIDINVQPRGAAQRCYVTAAVDKKIAYLIVQDGTGPVERTKEKKSFQYQRGLPLRVSDVASMVESETAHGMPEIRSAAAERILETLVNNFTVSRELSFWSKRWHRRLTSDQRVILRMTRKQRTKSAACERADEDEKKMRKK